MLTRLLPPPKKSVLLLGPRGTGKSTWIRQCFPDAVYYDLLDSNEALRLSKEPSLFSQETQALASGSWVVVDEVQKIPVLMDEVHRLIEQRKLNFVLCGSSARKLKRDGVNLLAGRAIGAEMFPFVSAEVGIEIDFERVCSLGMMPSAYDSPDAVAYLRSYAQTYLQEEIRAEALTRDLGSFARFLEVAARQNGQITNVSNIAREAWVARQTVQGFFEILVDTLLGFWLPPWKLKRATKQVAHPKFFFFDSGVVRALSERLPYAPSREELGPLFETYMLHEIRAYLAYSDKRYPLYFWSSHDQVEVDLFCETRKGFVAIEFKAAKQWDKKLGKGLLRIQGELKKKNMKLYAVLPVERNAIVDGIEILPFNFFLQKMWRGEIFE
ncbi:MAG TPA: hypothetical protein DF383_10665 [Deltaproteobacteria bacterium]|nr:hypothetical protein [Deltaproteobacteria bacterium]